MIKFIDQILSVTLAILMGAMVLDVTWQIFTRFLTDTPSSWTEELARFMLIWIGLLGAAWAYRRRSHLGLSYFVEKLNPDMQKRMEIFSYLATALFAVLVMIYGGGKLVLLTLELEQSSPSLGWPIGYVYLVIPLSGALITIYAFDFIRGARAGEMRLHVDNEPRIGGE